MSTALTHIHDDSIVIRLAHPDDELTLRRLAELDSARPLVGSVLIAEAAGVPRAALSLPDGRSVADPFFPTKDLIDLLKVRAARLRGHGRRGRLGFGLLDGRRHAYATRS